MVVKGLWVEVVAFDVDIDGVVVKTKVDGGRVVVICGRSILAELYVSGGYGKLWSVKQWLKLLL